MIAHHRGALEMAQTPRWTRAGAPRSRASRSRSSAGQELEIERLEEIGARLGLLQARSASTIAATISSKVFVGAQPRTSLARRALPTSSPASSGRAELSLRRTRLRQSEIPARANASSTNSSIECGPRGDHVVARSSRGAAHPRIDGVEPSPQSRRIVSDPSSRVSSLPFASGLRPRDLAGHELLWPARGLSG